MGIMIRADDEQYTKFLPTLPQERKVGVIFKGADNGLLVSWAPAPAGVGSTWKVSKPAQAREICITEPLQDSFIFCMRW